MTAVDVHVSPILSASVEIDTPALVVDETILRTNIAEMADLSRRFGVSLRPHAKTHKTLEVARMQIEAGAVGIMCAKLSEAEVFARAGITDIAIGYQIVGTHKLDRLLALSEIAHITVAVDDRAAAEALSAAARARGRTIDVYLEIDTGHHRAGVQPGEPAVTMAEDLARLSGIRLAGIMTHEGHANAAPPEEIEGLALAAGEAMVSTAEQIRRRGIEVPTVSVGSTQCAAITPSVTGVTEMRPGTYVFRDTSGFRHGHYGPDRCAARYVATVVNRPAFDRAIIDAGSKTLAMDRSPSLPGHGFIIGHPGAVIEWLNEEHGVVRLPPESASLAIGDRVEIVPNHVCPSVNLHGSMAIVRDGRIVDHWQVAARGCVT